MQTTEELIYGGAHDDEILLPSLKGRRSPAEVLKNPSIKEILDDAEEDIANDAPAEDESDESNFEGTSAGDHQGAPKVKSKSPKKKGKLSASAGVEDLNSQAERDKEALIDNEFITEENKEKIKKMDAEDASMVFRRLLYSNLLALSFHCY